MALHRLTQITLGALDVAATSDYNVVVEIAGRLAQKDAPTPLYNAPGRDERPDVCAEGVLREDRVRPRKLGHVVLDSTDQAGSQRFFTEGLGFKISDTVPGLAALGARPPSHRLELLLICTRSGWQLH